MERKTRKHSNNTKHADIGGRSGYAKIDIRTEWDLNPRYAYHIRQFSRLVP